ncbi:Ydc2-catalyt-domain-containing protein [Annulohypoxylon maeteangense]|uniref:Ydc2-catalyt-domain-containing protein n=1 Tax=Annulohypoxylon maeteangense TaxID=1927788 RepID=UPI002008DABE|nr:Ydc2-catalyt-domain-containing protein [Annulohypoxylon maeteangense]KAI0882572.1 Ydc2-catalyt-domain-containing protein [Annulohypoxylon maeteangense]
MPSTPETLLPKFKVAHLKQLASLCGAKTSGLKTELVERLLSISQLPAPKTQPLVLSIDMGIRNLGYSLLSPTAASSGRKKKPASLTAEALRSPLRINLHAWQRRELFDISPDDPVDPDQFSPASLAIAADRLVRQDLLPLKPTHVVIERQRWRNQGAAGILEWTVRVNTLEAMLHASLRTSRELGYWDGDVTSVSPANVARFWPVDPEDVPKSKARKGVEGKARKESKSMQSKRYKIGVLTGWLKRESKDQVILPGNDDIENAIQQFRLRLGGARKSKSRVAEEFSAYEAWPRKLDDLTDCLLQGVAWLKWEENRALLLNEKKLLELLDSDILDKEIVTPLDEI